MTVEMNLTRGFEIRTIRSGETLGCKGFAVEILDGGFSGGVNKLSVGRGQYGSDEAYADEASIRCWVGNRLVSTFDYIKLSAVSTNDPQLPDTVTVKIQTVRNAVVTDAGSVAMTRRRGLARNLTGIVAAAGTALLYTSNPQVGSGGTVTYDDWGLDSRLTDRGWIDGWITSVGAPAGAFTVWLLTARTASQGFPGTYSAIVKGNAQDRTVIPVFAEGTSVYAGAFAFTFDWQDGQNTRLPWRAPAGAWQLFVENTAASNQQYNYAITVRGTL